MADHLEDEDFIFYGTPIEDEHTSRPHKGVVVDPAKTRLAPVHQQEPTDEQGRKRFHGAFTGGFSAGYYNTVGSKEGWQPSTFRSSRSDRATVKAQTVDEFLDEDERQERGKVVLHVKPEYDTFGSTATEAARAVSQRDADLRPSLIPGPAISDILSATAAPSLGAQLLQTMGWRPGRGIVTAPTSETATAAETAKKRKWGTVAGVSLDNTPLYVLEPKQDNHGLGFDPFEGADDFRELKKQRQEQKQADLQAVAAEATSKLGMGGGSRAAGKRPRGVAFAGVAEDSGMYGYMEDYVDEDEAEAARPTKMSVLTGGHKAGYNFELGDSGSDDEMAAGRRKRPMLLEAADTPAVPMLQDAAQLRRGGDFIPGFKKADEQVVIPIYEAPQVPDDYVPYHTFPSPEQTVDKPASSFPPPPEVPPPQDPGLRKEIDSLAALVARSGAGVEELARKQAVHAGDQATLNGRQGSTSLPGLEKPKFSFLVGGEGALYYTWRLHKIRSAIEALSKPGTIGSEATVAANNKAGSGRAAMTVEQRMALLGEEALPSTSAAQQALMQAQQLAAAQAIKPQVAQGDKERIRESLGRMFVKADNQDMASGSDHVAVGLRQPTAAASDANNVKAAGSVSAAVLAGLKSRFAPSANRPTVLDTNVKSAGLIQPSALQQQKVEAAKATAEAPKRWFEDWRPDPLVCKRFNVPDPYKGKPQAVQMSKFKTDYLALPETAMGLGGLGAAKPAMQIEQPSAGVPVGLPPPPPLPADMQAAVARAAAIAQRLTGAAQAEAETPLTIAQSNIVAPTTQQGPKGYAASFLDSLAQSGLFSGAGQPQATQAPTEAQQQEQQPMQSPMAPDAAVETGEEAAVAASADFPAIDRPLDIFKAIFEDTADEDSETEEATQDTLALSKTQQADATAGGNTAQTQAVTGTAAQIGLATALLRAQELATQKQQAAELQQRSVGPTMPPAMQQQTSTVQQDQPITPEVQPSALSVDPEVQQRILAALSVLKKSKKEKSKRKSDKKKKHSKRKHRKEKSKSKSRKHEGKGSASKDKARSHDRSARSKDRRRSLTRSDSMSENDDYSTDDSDGSSASSDRR